MNLWISISIKAFHQEWLVAISETQKSDDFRLLRVLFITRQNAWLNSEGFFHSIYFEGLVYCSQVKAAKLTKDLEPELVRVELHWSSCVSCVTTNKQKHHTCTTRLKLDPNVKKNKNFMGCLMEATAWDKPDIPKRDRLRDASALIVKFRPLFLFTSFMSAWMCSCLSTILWCRKPLHKPDGDIF